jgi:PilZ domain-containing protein
MAKEARRSKRTPHDSVLELFDKDGRLLAGVQQLVDVSAVGVSFIATHAFRKGDVVHGRLRLLETGVLEITGRVVRLKERSNSTLYAIEFESVKGRRPPGLGGA